MKLIWFEILKSCAFLCGLLSILIQRKNALNLSVSGKTICGMINGTEHCVCQARAWFAPLAKPCCSVNYVSWFICFVWHFSCILFITQIPFSTLIRSAYDLWLNSFRVMAFQLLSFFFYCIEFKWIDVRKRLAFYAFSNGKLNEKAIWSMITY